MHRRLVYSTFLILLLCAANSVTASLDRFYQFETHVGSSTPDSAGGVSGTLYAYPVGGSIVADTGGVTPHNGRVKKAENVMSCIPWGGMYSTYSGFTGSNDTVAFWFKTDGPWVPGADNWNTLFNCNAEYNLQVGGNDETGLMADGYILSWSWNGSVASSKVVTPLAYDDGDWHHLVRTFEPYNAGGTKIYVDGLLVAGSIYNGSAPGGSNALQVGMASTTGWASYFKGRIDNVRCYSNVLSASDVWNLYVSESIGPPPSSPPAKPINPSPSNGAVSQTITAKISWSDGGDVTSYATSYDVYFGTNPAPDSGEFKGNQTEFSYDPGTLFKSTRYYWRIDAKNSVGTTTGDVWSFTTTTAKPTIYYIDLKDNGSLSDKALYDLRHTAVCIQGIVNQEAPRIFVSIVDADLNWLNRLQESNGLCEGWTVKVVSGVGELLNIFGNYINGVVLYDPDPDTGVISSSLVATTVAGVERAIAVRKDTSAGSMYNYLVNDINGPQLSVLVDLTGKFTGSGTIWQTSTPSTGSAKCDAYIWAKEKYIDTGKCDPTTLIYSLDLWGLKVNPVHADRPPRWQILLLANLDYAITKKGFCFELSPWGDEIPNDDPGQPLGTDLETYKKILNACNVQTGQSKAIKLCGFVNLDFKYSPLVGSIHDYVATEWEQVRLQTTYNTYAEADAPGLSWVSNCSFYTGLTPEILNRRYIQNTAPTYSDMVSRGLIDGPGNVVPGNYILLNMGDYDQVSWVLYWLASQRYQDPVRGQIYCNWTINPNATDRVSVAMDYMYRHKTSKDYFYAGDSGAGYINPNQLYGSRSPSGYPSGVGIWQKHCRKYYRLFDYSITGWLLNGASALTATDAANYAPFSGDGIGVYLGAPSMYFSGNSPVNTMKGDLGLGGTGSVMDYASGVNFGWYRTILWFPQNIKNLENNYANSGHNHRFLDAYTFYYLMRYYLGGNNNYRATWVSDTIPRIMAAGQTYPVTATVRNDGWDTWSEANLYRLGHAVVSPGVIPVYADYDPIRHYLPTGTAVAPGQTVTFSFNLTAPSTNGNYGLYYDMVRDGYTWFRTQNNIEWKKEIVVATKETDVDTDGDGISDVVEEANGTLYWHPDDAVYKKGDFDLDGDVDIFDLAVLAAHWLQDYPPADIAPESPDGIVNLRDYSVLTQDWLYGTVW